MERKIAHPGKLARAMPLGENACCEAKQSSGLTCWPNAGLEWVRVYPVCLKKQPEHGCSLAPACCGFPLDACGILWWHVTLFLPLLV